MGEPSEITEDSSTNQTDTGELLMESLACSQLQQIIINIVIKYLQPAAGSLDSLMPVSA